MSWVQKGLDIDGNKVNGKCALAISPNGNVVAMGATERNNFKGSVSVYEYVGSTWVQRGSDINGENEEDEFGVSISLSDNGNIVAIGAPFNSENIMYHGHVRVYEWVNNTEWVPRGSDINGEQVIEKFGNCVSLSSNGNILAIGGPLFDSVNSVDSGRVRIYEWKNNTEWVQLGSDIYGDSASNIFGDSLSLSSDGNIVAVGAPMNSDNGEHRGKVRVYEWNGTEWAPYGAAIYGNHTALSFGTNLSLSPNGNVLAISTPYRTGGIEYDGSISVYEYKANEWVRRGLDIYNTTIPNNISGFSVSLSFNGNILAIGDSFYTEGGGRKGAVNIYEWNNTTWTPYGTILNTSNSGAFGSGVALSYNGDSIFSTGYGIARVYSFTEPTLAPICFLADAPVLTPTGYRPISSITVGDMVRTAAGGNVTVKRVFAKEYSPSVSANPFVIPKGMFGALRALLISPNHEVMTPKGMVKAKDIGLPRMKMTGSFTYYNLELEDWVRDNLVVAGVTCESLAPAKRITMTKAEFVAFVKARYGPASAARLRLQSVCFEESDGYVSLPALQ